MNNLTGLFLFPWLVSTLIAFVVTSLVIRFARRLKIMDDPAKNKHPKVIHTYPVPRGGGIPIFAALLVGSLIFLPVDPKVIGILAGALILTVMGYLDDRLNLNPYLRLFIGFIAASMPIAAGIGISFISNPLGGIINLNWMVSDLFAVFWITFLMNIVNMGAKGVDGQLSGVTVVSALTIAFLSLKFSADLTQWPVIILAAITGGAYFGFLPWHVYPQKIMPGYGGSTLAGYMLAVLSILSTTKVGALMVVLGVPLIDTGYTIMRRILSGKSPVWGDRGHLHHRLLDAGLTKMQVALLYWGITAILGLLALNLNTATKLYTMIGIAFALGALILFLTRKKADNA
ncbi:MAG: Glycosyl transferase, family 4, conserved region-containing protein [Candidatus Woesebacteria bacterium GW2011_GWB1_45_5]|uniref:Glycosyl transferase, family 4, conserved region-containing protein n=1 Tax=Candidatus Woesebacteria bacterium GW2011_GWB1_45_5 TaxID=1618581 RepID=A0A0G1MR83_9BACT|nr:MAG: Glycosyl transferase, family 4, conserved region-containing protein [Candidatus Woesebacteria bacterium GW2011_GWB1_45_5]